MNIFNQNWFRRALPCFAIFIIITAIHIRLYPYAFDDAFIHFRVARNLVATGYPYYNVNDALKVSTSSGWVVFLTLLYWVANKLNAHNQFPLLISMINALILVCTLLVYKSILEKLLNRNLSIPLTIAFSILMLAILLPSSIGLMETPLSLLVVGTGIHFLLINKPIGFTLLGFATYVRLELSFLTTIIIIILILQKRFRIPLIVGYFVLGIIPFIFFDMYYYHTLMPHSITAKSIVYPFPPLRTLLQIISLSLPAIPIIKTQTWFITARVLLFIIAIVFTGWAALRERHKTKNSWPILLFISSLCVIAMYTLGHALLFDWYIPLYMIPILVAFVFYNINMARSRKNLINLPLITLLAISLVFLFSTAFAAIFNPYYFTLFESGARVKSYLAIGRIINEDYPNARLLTSEIGGLGFSFHGQILDAAGLASSAALAFHPMEFSEDGPVNSIGTIPPGYVNFTKPEIIVSYDAFSHELLSDEISTQYNIITFPAYLPEDAPFSRSETLWGSKHLRVFILKSLPVSKKLCAMAVKTDEIPNNSCGT